MLQEKKAKLIRLRSFVLISLVGLSAEAAASAPELNGNWTVDLSTEPDKSYTKPMVLYLRSDGSVQGSFYESKIEGGRWKMGIGWFVSDLKLRTSNGWVSQVLRE